MRKGLYLRNIVRYWSESETLKSRYILYKAFQSTSLKIFHSQFGKKNSNTAVYIC